jgi:hypothetical protein
MHKKIIVAFGLAALSSFAIAQVTFYQPDKLVRNITGFDGRQIEIQTTFNPPVSPQGILIFKIGDETALEVANHTMTAIERFTTRFRMKQGEKIVLTIKTSSETKVFDFKPVIETDYTPPTSDEYSPKPIYSTKIASLYGARKGDCVHLITGISNSGPKKPAGFEIETDFGKIRLQSSARISTNPLFTVGATSETNLCKLNIFD